ncbi:MAG: GNAT family N-acetyltransferase [Nesterenkonia sp.]|uniref:GNAT family N-acetyltransferase n=1 Tax=Nesterenkonia marinintestina TaxID=2979865 RepID=UPI0021C02EEE|nr:GNAT family N-acetyltransferase [Nesterenkonia sp. GX14115]MDO5493157.1 GNAT family N-acetyltransferase [Nesterenkonia sp.]
MTSELNDDLVRTWVTGWARTHDFDVQHDGAVHSALRSDSTDQWEYIVYSPDQTDLRKVSSAVAKGPNRLLTVVVEPGQDSLDDPEGHGLRLISDEEKLMVVDMGIQDVEDPITPEGFTTEREDFEGWTLFTVRQGEHMAARGRLAVVGNHAILDRIYTNPDFRRQGLGTFVTRALTAIALERDVEEGLLVATEDGQELYEFLGWTLLGDVHMYGGPKASESESTHSQFDEIDD